MDAGNEKVSFDREVRRYVYDHVIGEGLPPTVAEAVNALGRTTAEVALSFRRLADEHILVLQKGSGEILMAAPFSAVPTAFLVKAGGRQYYGNCIWDALGIPSMLGQDATVSASCGCCGTAVGLKVTNGSLEEGRGLAHFAIPAARWWDDVVFS